MKLSERNEAFRVECYVVIDIADAPRLANAIGSRIWKRKSAAEAFAANSRRFRNSEDGRRIHVVAVEGRNEHFAVDHLDASDVTVKADGTIRMAVRR